MHLRLSGFAALCSAFLSAVFGADFNPATATNQVGLDVFRQLSKDGATGNLIVSPYSIESALALAYVGAEGTTRAEMAKALRLPDDDTAVAAGFRTLQQSVAISAGPKTELRIANRLFGQSGYAFRETFLNRMANEFAAPFEAMDFAHAAAAARSGINGWVSVQTNAKIRDLVPPRGIEASTRLVLVNALYFKARWETEFKKNDTERREFHLANGATVRTPTMHATKGLGYSKEPRATVVALNYQMRGLQCLIILPDEGQSVDEVAKELTADDFARWKTLGTGKGWETVSLFLPKFRTAHGTLPLGKALRTLGIRSAFDEPKGTANFDRIAPRRPNDYLALSEVFHQTFVALDEEGTEAAAATAVRVLTLGGFAAPPPKPIEVRVDRPFLFAIQHCESGACLFLGRITDPR